MSISVVYLFQIVKIDQDERQVCLLYVAAGFVVHITFISRAIASLGHNVRESQFAEHAILLPLFQKYAHSLDVDHSQKEDKNDDAPAIIQTVVVAGSRHIEVC